MAESRSVFPLPASLAAIDGDWLTAALRVNAPDAAVTRFAIDDVFNATSTSVRLHLELNEAGRKAGIPDVVYLKGGFQEHSLAMAPMHKLETLGYRDLLPRGGLNAPACYFADWDEANQHGIIIMEDLTRRGGAFGHLRITRKPQEVARGLAQLADYHARSWGHEPAKAGEILDWVRSEPILETDGYQDCLTPENHRRFMTMPRAGAASVYFKDREWMLDAIRRIGILSRSVPNCIHHGDPNPGNIFFQDNGGVAFFDIVPRRGPALFEVAYHITLSLDPIDRPSCERDLVRGYLAELRSHGVEPPTLEEAMFQYGVFLTEALIMCMFNPPGIIPEDLAVTPVARLNAAMIDHDSLALLQTLA